MQKLLDFFETVYDPLRLRGKSELTRHHYRVQIRHFHRYLRRAPTLADLTDDGVARFLSWFRKGRSPATVNKARNCLLAMWRLAARKTLVAVWPDVAPEPEPERVPRAWMPEELTKLFGACQLEEGEVGGVPAAKWFRCIHLCMWDTAERVHAVMALRWSDVDLANGWVIVPAEARKGKHRDKAFSLHPDTVAALREIQEPRRELVFPWPFDVSYLYVRYKKLLRRAGLPTDRKSKFHRMRKSAASYMEAAGGNATDFLDHSSRDTTKAYLDPRICHRQQASSLLFRPDRPLNTQPPNGHHAENQNP